MYINFIFIYFCSCTVYEVSISQTTITDLTVDIDVSSVNVPNWFSLLPSMNVHGVVL